MSEQSKPEAVVPQANPKTAESGGIIYPQGRHGGLPGRILDCAVRYLHAVLAVDWRDAGYRRAKGMRDVAVEQITGLINLAAAEAAGGIDVGLGTPDGPPMDKPIETPEAAGDPYPEPKTWACWCGRNSRVDQAHCWSCGRPRPAEAAGAEELRNELAWMLARVISQSTDADGKPACECCELTCRFCIAKFLVQGRYAAAADQIEKWESLAEDADEAVGEQEPEAVSSKPEAEAPPGLDHDNAFRSFVTYHVERKNVGPLCAEMMSQYECGFQAGESKQAILEVRGREKFLADLKSKPAEGGAGNDS